MWNGKTKRGPTAGCKGIRGLIDMSNAVATGESESKQR
jgi:hypothetical protein